MNSISRASLVLILVTQLGTQPSLSAGQQAPTKQLETSRTLAPGLTEYSSKDPYGRAIQYVATTPTAHLQLLTLLRSKHIDTSKLTQRAPVVRRVAFGQSGCGLARMTGSGSATGIWATIRVTCSDGSDINGYINTIPVPGAFAADNLTYEAAGYIVGNVSHTCVTVE